MTKNLDGFKLKVIAIVCMVISNLTFPLTEVLPFSIKFVLHAVGGVTFLTMAFLAVEGYRNTKKLKKYILRLVLLGAIATPFHIITFGFPLLNIMFTMTVGLLSVVLYDKIKFRWLFWIIFALVILPISAMFLEFFFLGVTSILLYHIIRNEKARRIGRRFLWVCFCWR